MKIKQSRKFTELVFEDPVDVFLAGVVLTPGIEAEAEVMRRIRRDYGERAAIEKKPVKIRIKVKEIRYTEGGVLLKGFVVEAPEGIKGIQSITVREGSKIRVFPPLTQKELYLLQKYGRKKTAEYLIALISPREAFIWDGNTGSYITGPQSGKEITEEAEVEFAKKVAAEVAAYGRRYVIIGGHGKIRHTLAKLLTGKDIKVFVESTSYIGYGGVKEIFARKALSKVLGAVEEEFEFNKLQELLQLMKRSPEKVVVGKNSIEELEAGRLEELVVSIEFPEIAGKAIKKAELYGTKVYLFFRNKEVLDMLKSFEGVIGKRRW